MRKIYFLLLLSLVAYAAFAEDDSPLEAIAKSSAVGGGLALRLALTRADIAIHSNRIPSTHVQGAFGEHVSASQLNRSHGWQQLRQSIGRNGIDQIHLKVGRDGLPRDLAVSEVKTGNARLGQTTDGLQMASRWRSVRLRALANRYRSIGADYAEGKIEMSRPSSAHQMKHVLELPLSDNESVRFWRESSKRPWKLDASRNQLPKVERQVGRIADFVEAAGEDRIEYRKRLIQIKRVGGDLVSISKDATGLDEGKTFSQLRELRRQSIPIRGGGRVGQALTKAYADELHRLYPDLSDRNVRGQARELSKATLRKNLDFGTKPLASVVGSRTLSQAGLAAIIAGGADAGFGLLTRGEVDVESLGVNAMAGVTAGTLGELSAFGTTNYLLNSSYGASVTSRVASSMGLASTSYTANLLGSAVGGGVAAAGFSYVLYFAGYADLETANRAAVAGVAGSLAGFAANAGITSLVMAYGTAGTGTAISTLSGAASTSATLAALGGGSMATGSVVLATGVGIVVVGVGVAVAWGYSLHDSKQENLRLQLTYKYLDPYYLSELR